MVLRSFLVLLGLNLQLLASKRIDIHLGFQDCISCFSALSALESLTGFDKTIIIYKEDSLVAEEFLSRFEISDDVNYSYSNRQVQGSSYCKVYDQNVLTDSFNLRNLPEKARLLKIAGSNDQPLRKLRLPPKLVFNKERLDIAVNGPFTNIYDYILNKVVVLETGKDTIKKIVEIKGSQFNPALFFRASPLDSALYFSCYKTLKKIGKSEAHIENVFLSDSTLNLLINFPYVYLDPKTPKDTSVGMSFFLYQRNLYTDAKKLSFINHDALISKYSFQYAINNALPFFIKANQAYFSISDFKKTDNSIKLFSTWNYNSKNYEFSQLDKLSIDKASYLKYDYNDLNFMINRQFYFNATLKLIFDYKNFSVVNVPDLKINMSESYITDICQEKSLLKMLVLKTDGVDLIVYDLKSHKTVSRSNLELPQNSQAATAKFSDFNTVELMDKGCSYLYFLNANNLH